MTPTIITFLVLQWIAILGIGVLCLGLARQIGVLHRRLGPAGALMLSRRARVGEASPQLDLLSIDGAATTIGGANPDGKATLLMFVAPDCPVCAKLTPIVKAIGQSEARYLRVVFASDGNRDEHLRYRREKGLETFDYVLSGELGRAFEVGKLPYAILIDETGVISSQGLINSREHIDSLFEARRLGVASIQDFLAQNDDHETIARPA